MAETEQPGATEEEIAEAHKFNTMVDEGKLTTAEAAALEKDKNPEEVEAEKEAMEKLITPDSKNYVIHSTPPQFLEKILQQGLIPSSLAYRATRRGIKGVKIEPQFDVSSGDVSLWDFSGRGIFPTYEISASDPRITLLIDRKGVKRKEKDLLGTEDMYYSTKRIRPNFIIGLVGSKYLNPEELVDVAKKFKIPFYDHLGNLLSPFQMTHEQVKQFVAERDAEKAEEREKEK